MNKLNLVTQLAPEDDLEIFKNMLRSAKFADQIIVYNLTRQDDEFKQLIKSFKAKIIDAELPHVIEELRAKQVGDCQSEWVMVMDFDEVITPALADEITTTINSSDPKSAYFIPRRNYSLGFPLTHGGWGDDRVVRLFKREKFLDWPKEIHALPTFKGQSGTLKNFMEHHKDASLAQMVDKTNRYSQIESQQFYQGRLARVTPLTLFRKMHMEMLRRGVFKRGLLDGRIGLIQSIYQGFSVFISYAKLYELQQQRKDD